MPIIVVMRDTRQIQLTTHHLRHLTENKTEKYAFIISTTLNLRFRPNTTIIPRSSRIRVRKHSIHQECKGTPGGLSQGSCVVPGVKLDLPQEFDVVYANVLQFLEQQVVAPQGDNSNRLGFILFDFVGDLQD